MTKNNNRWIVVVLAVACLPLSSCGGSTSAYQKIEPAHVEPIAGSELSRVTLSDEAMQRLDVQTAPVREMNVTRSQTPQKVVPYSAVLYDAHGKTWVYTCPKPRTFVRHQISVDYIEGDLAVLSDGPSTGTGVVTVGVAEVYGTEFEMGH